jgi:hypothetical protein
VIINAKPEKAPPKPLRDYLLVEVRKVGNDTGLILPDGAEGTLALFAVECGPEVEGIAAGDELECNHKLAMSRATRISERYFLMPSDLILGVYR